MPICSTSCLHEADSVVSAEVFAEVFAEDFAETAAVGGEPAALAGWACPKAS